MFAIVINVLAATQDTAILTTYSMSTRHTDEEACGDVAETPRLRGRYEYWLRDPKPDGAGPQPLSVPQSPRVPKPDSAPKPRSDRDGLVLVTLSTYRLRWAVLKTYLTSIFQPRSDREKRLWGLDHDQSSVGELYMFYLPRALSQVRWIMCLGYEDSPEESLTCMYSQGERDTVDELRSHRSANDYLDRRSSDSPDFL